MPTMRWRFSLIKTLRCAGGFSAYDVLSVHNYDVVSSAAEMRERILEAHSDACGEGK